MTVNYHNLDLVNINANTKFGKILSISFQDIELKRNSDISHGTKYHSFGITMALYRLSTHINLVIKADTQLHLQDTIIQGWAVETNPGFNRLKPPRSICKKVVNTNLSGRLKILMGCFRGGFEILGQNLSSFYWKKNEKKVLFRPCQGHFYLSTDFCITVQAPNTLYSFLIIKGRLE